MQAISLKYQKKASTKKKAQPIKGQENIEYKKDLLNEYQLTPMAFLIPQLQMACEIDKTVREWLDKEG